MNRIVTKEFEAFRCDGDHAERIAFPVRAEVALLRGEKDTLFLRAAPTIRKLSSW